MGSMGTVESKKRHGRIVAAAVSALFGRGTAFIVNAVTIPLTVRYLGPERYGLWVTISTTVMMCFVLDIGIANTLTNLISEAYADEDRGRAAGYFATTFWMVLG